MKGGTADSAFSRALVAEILASERLRVRVLAATLTAVLAAILIMFGLAGETIRTFSHGKFHAWIPTAVFAPFIAYDCFLSFLLSRFMASGRQPPVFARFVNAAVETSLPTVAVVASNYVISPLVAFGAWPSLFYFIYIVAATLRLDFALPMFTGAVAAAGYLAAAFAILPLSTSATDPLNAPIYHIGKAIVMLSAGVVAGMVALRLRGTFRRVVEESSARERVTSLFGQHVSPAVVDRLLARPVEPAGEVRTVCVMFLDIRDFTANARTRPPAQVIAFLNDAFAAMIEAIDRHHGIINKFLGDGFMAVFGAPLDDPQAAGHAVAAARDILGEIDRRGLAAGDWPLRVGIGLHCGQAVTGNVGSPRRKEFTIVGDVVNLASRLEQLNKEHGSRLLVSDAVIAALGPAETAGAIRLGAVALKGYAEPVPVWRLDS